VYGGSSGKIFSEVTIPKPINEYGFAKLQTEGQLLEFAKHSNLTIVIFRLANIYGPGQDMSKSQGIISAIANSLHYHKPVNIFVSLKTVRNFIYADDAGEVIARCVTQLAKDRKSNIFLKLVASDRNISLSSLMNEFRLVYGRRPMVVNTVPDSAVNHPVNLQLQSNVDDSSQNLSFTPLAVGIYRVRQGFFS
jgi:UDP-glucose 4-epimerase